MERTKRAVTPGEKLAVIEEFSSGRWTYEEGGVIRASKVGEVLYQKEVHELLVKPSKGDDRLPKLDDSIMGQVENVQSSSITVRIHYINGERFLGGIAGTIFSEQSRPVRQRGPRRIICKQGDIVRAKVISTLNGIVHLSFDGRDLGVIYATCGLCGGRMVSVGHKVKCLDCANLEERKLAEDFDRAHLK